MILAAVSWRGYLAFKPKYSPPLRPPPTWDQIRRGEVKPLSGPYIYEGDSNSLQFEVIDLGIGWVKSISEGGDVLYTWFGDKPIEFPYKDSDGFMRTGIKPDKAVTRIRRNNGTIEDFRENPNVTLSRSGKAFGLGQPGSMNVFYNGKDLLASTRRKSGFMFSSSAFQMTISDDGVFLDNTLFSQYLFDKNFEVTELKLPRHTVARFEYESSGLGTAGLAFGENGFDKLGLVHQGKFDLIDLPETVSYNVPEVLGSKDAFFIHVDPYNPSPIYEYRAGKFSKVAVPEGIFNLKMAGANSVGDFLMDVERLDNAQKTGVGNPLRRQAIYVHGEKYYDLNQILRSIGLEGGNTRRPDGTVQFNNMDEQGSFVVWVTKDNFLRIYLAKRKK